MKTPTLQLTKNLRKSLLRGNPWIYQRALSIPNGLSEAGLCKVVDAKNDFIGWGLYSPESPLSVRIVSLSKKPPSPAVYEERLSECWSARQHLLNAQNNCFRLVNGEGDLLPGFICDVYNDVAVLQFDGDGPYKFWDQDFLANWLLNNLNFRTVVYKPRHDSTNELKTWGEKLNSYEIEVIENSCRYLVDVKDGQKTGFFLDQRGNREYLQKKVKGFSVLNLFSYSGGFSIAAGLGGASLVTSVDISQGAIDLATKNWELNDLDPDKHHGICADVFEYVKQPGDKFDVVVCDPPSLAKSEKTKDQAVRKYTEVFALSAKKVKSGGNLMLSSCSSHISFLDFDEIVSAALSSARRSARVLRVSGQGSDHPYPHACPHLRYLKFMDLKLD